MDKSVSLIKQAACFDFFVNIAVWKYLLIMRKTPVLFFVVFLVIPIFTYAQITAPQANAIRFSNYSSSTDKDPIFVFCVSPGFVSATIIAQDSAGSLINDFNWYKWDDVAKDFSIPVKSESSVASSRLDNISESGGYRVKVSNGSGSSLFTCWVFIDEPVSSAQLMSYGCDYVALDGTAAVDTFYYYDPLTGSPIKLPNAVRHLWSSTPASSIPYPDLRIDPYTYDPPLSDVTYKLVVTDSMTCSSESSFYYESIHVKAGLKADVLEGEAPLEVNFSNESIRGYNYVWDFGDDSETSLLETPETHTFYRPGKYTVKLEIESEQLCEDADSITITVKPSLLNIPNAFTPNDDGYNDRFLVDKQSLRYLNVQIFTNTGAKVYGFAGDTESLRNWEGWDGNVNNTGRKAGPGVYYYIINAIGWDDERYEGNEYRGVLYLYR